MDFFRIMDFFRAALVISGVIASIYFTDFIGTMAGPYHLEYLFDIVVFAWFLVEINLSSTNASRQKGALKVGLLAIFLLCISIAIHPDYQVANSKLQLEEAEKREIETDYSEFNVPEKEWAGIISKGLLQKKKDIFEMQQKLRLVQSRDTTSELSITLLVFAGILIIYSMLKFILSGTMDEEEVCLRLEFERQEKASEFRETLIKMEAEKNKADASLQDI